MALTKVTEKIISDNLSISGIASASNFKTGTTNVHNVGVEAAGINVLGADTPIGTGATIYNDGGARFSGVVTATTYYGSGANLTGIDATSIKHTNGDIKAQASASGVTITGNLGVSGVLTYEDVTNIDSVGVITARSTVSIADSIIHTGDTNTSLRFPAADTITAETGGLERLRIKSNGYVGIGTENPQRPLAVTSGTSGVTAEFNVPDNAPTGSAGLSLNIVNRSNSGYAPLSFNATLYTFGNSGTERLRIDNNGRLLLGTTSVGNASAYYDNLIISNTTSGEGSGITLFAATNGFNAVDFADTAAVGRGRITYAHSDDSLRIDTAGSERLRIDSSGRMILGATSTIGNTYSDNFTISEASGDVGMQFAGNNSTSNYASIYFGDAGHRQKHFIETQLGTNGHFTIGTIGTGPIRFTQSGGERLRIDSGGRLVIGHTAAPYNDNDKLQVVTSSGGTGIVVDEYSADAWGPSISMLKSRNASIGGNTVVQNGDRLADFNFYGNDGAGRALGAQIGVRVDGTPGSDDMPSRIVFATSADGSQSPTERLSIKSDGKIIVPTTGKLSLGTSSPVAQFTAGTANGSRVIEIQGTDGVIRGYDRNSSAWAQIAFEGASYSFDCGGTERWKINTYGETVTEESSHGWSTYEMHAKDGGTRFHYRGIGAGASGATINLIRVRRHYWGSGFYHIKLRQRYYNGSAEGHWWLHGHGRNTGGHSPSWQLNHTNHNNMGGSKVQITSNSNSSPGDNYAGYTDVYANIGAYEYFEVVIETSLMAGYNHSISNVGVDSYALHPF